MTEMELKDRTKPFALRVLKLIDTLPETRSGRVLANQLGRAGTSVGANYRAACRSRSVAEMISKFSVVEEEADESAFWLGCVCKMSLREGPPSGPTKQSSWIATARHGGPRDDRAFCKHTLELIAERGRLVHRKLAPLVQEAGELTAIMVASRKTLRFGNQKSRIENRK